MEREPSKEAIFGPQLRRACGETISLLLLGLTLGGPSVLRRDCSLSSRPCSVLAQALTSEGSNTSNRLRLNARACKKAAN
jgi:hypothetical protein